MVHSLLTGSGIVAGALALCASGYDTLCLWSAHTFLCDGRRVPAPDFTPPVSILKPLRGTDPEMYEAFRSHCLQDYPDYELVFGVAEATDPAVALVERLQCEFPRQSIQLLVCPLVLGANPKVSNLVQMLPHARHEYLLINDSDIRVPSDYLRRVMAPMSNPQVGMVTSLYRGAPAATIASKLEALGISTDFAAAVLAARQLEGIHFGLGATLGFSRRSLTEIGGFESLLDYLADDFQLGARIAAAGHKVILSDVIVDTHLPPYTFGEYCNHQLRWARAVRDSRKWGYLGTVLTFGLPWAMLAVVLARGVTWTWLVLGITVVFRIAVALVVGKRVMRDPQIPADLWLLPLRDLFALGIWAASYAGHSVVWRGRQFILKDGKLQNAGNSAIEPAADRVIETHRTIR